MGSFVSCIKNCVGCEKDNNITSYYVKYEDSHDYQFYSPHMDTNKI